MTFSVAEVFLLVWAITATIACGILWRGIHRATELLAGAVHLVDSIAKGEATVERTANGINVTRKGEEV